MSLNIASNADEIYNTLINESRDKVGIICLNFLIKYVKIEDLREFLIEKDIQIAEKIEISKLNLLKYITQYFYNEYQSSSQNQALYSDALLYIGEMMLKNDKFRNIFKMHDFLSKQELINAFADWCADLGISVFSTSEISEYSLDLYFTKKKPILRTEAVFIRTGEEMDKDNYEKTLRLIKDSTKISAWTVFATTPLGVYNIGLFKLIGDMERLNSWLYIIDPLKKRILGVLKGKKSKNYDSDLRDEYIKKLPREPIRAPSQVVKFSKYNLVDAELYKSSKFKPFEVLDQQAHEALMNMPFSEPKYKNIFRNIIISDKHAGLPMVSFSGDIDQADEVLISGFLSAMDDFVSQIGGTTAMKDINYKGFFVQAVYGEYIKIALFLSEPADQILKERVKYFLMYFEDNFQNEIESFKAKGNANVFNDKEIISLAKEILEI